MYYFNTVTTYEDGVNKLAFYLYEVKTKTINKYGDKKIYLGKPILVTGWELSSPSNSFTITKTAAESLIYDKLIDIKKRIIRIIFDTLQKNPNIIVQLKP